MFNIFKKKKKFWIGGLILLIAALFLGYRGFVDSATYYYTVNEVLTKYDTLSGETIRVNGIIIPGSVSQQGGTLNFTVTGEDSSLPVFYQGVVPDSFKAGNEIVIEGQLTPEGTFKAQTLMPKCPSKYTPAE